MAVNGVLVIDKPPGFTSFDVIAVVRKLTGQRRIGHTGTLDPNATGVLPVLLGSATKAQDILPDHTKAYTAGFRFGTQTDTLDVWGTTLREEETDLDEAAVLAILPRFRGDIMQVPPMVSALKKDGRRLYDLARQGVEVVREPRPVCIHRLELLSFDRAAQSGTLEAVCSKGTYIRSLIDDIGAALGSCAVMTSLRRTAACGFSLADCVTLDRLRNLAESGGVEALLRPVESLFDACPSVKVSEAQAKRFRNGGALDLCRTALRGRELPDGTVYRVYGGDFLGLAVTGEGMLKIYKLFPE